MSQLDSMLKELKKSLSDDVNLKTAAIGSEMSAAESTALIKEQSQALRDFLKNNPSNVSAGVKQESDDPKVILSRREALSSFVGIPIKNNGKASLPGTIAAESQIPQGNNGHGGGHGAAHGSAHGGAHGNSKHENKTENAAPIPGFSPPPQVVIKYVDAPCKKCEENAEKEKEAVKEAAQKETSKPSQQAPGASMAMPYSSTSEVAAGMGGMGFSKPVTARPEPEEEKAGAEERNKTEKEALKQDAKSGKKQGFGLFNVFGGNKEAKTEKNEERKSESAEAPAPAAPPAAKPAMIVNAQAAAQVAWFKHIQAIESALRIGDVHFADSLLSLLTEVSHSVTAPGNIKARLDSMQARIHIDRKFYGEAEELLQKTIKNAEGTPLAKNISIAYCWHALAQCYNAQKKAPEAEKARQTAIEIATEALGENDPETVLLKAPL